MGVTTQSESTYINVVIGKAGQLFSICKKKKMYSNHVRFEPDMEELPKLKLIRYNKRFQDFFKKTFKPMIRILQWRYLVLKV